MLGELHSVTSTVRHVLAAAVVLTAVQCAPQEVVKPSPPQPAGPEVKKERKAPLAEYEATLNPSDFDEEVGTVLKEGEEPDRAVQRIDIPQDSVVYEEEVRQGFRIQIFSSANIDEISQMRIEAATRITADSIYVVFDAPVYKIRIGDYASRYEANTKLPALIDLGYRDSWIVPDRVIVRRAVSTPAPQ